MSNSRHVDDASCPFIGSRSVSSRAIVTTRSCPTGTLSPNSRTLPRGRVALAASSSRFARPQTGRPPMLVRREFLDDAPIGSRYCELAVRRCAGCRAHSAACSSDRLRATNDKPPTPSAPPQSIFAMHLVNGEHYSGAERVQDLLARQLPRFGCEVGFACVKPQRFPSARETKTAPLVEMPMRGRFDLRIVKQIAELVPRRRLRLDPRPHAADRAGRPVGGPHAPACRSSITSTARPAAIRRAACSIGSTPPPSGPPSAVPIG